MTKRGNKAWQAERRELLNQGLKRCCKCELIKPTYQYSIKKGDYASDCKACCAADTRARTSEWDEFKREQHNQMQRDISVCREEKPKRRKRRWEL